MVMIPLAASHSSASHSDLDLEPENQQPQQPQLGVYPPAGEVEPCPGAAEITITPEPDCPACEDIAGLVASNLKIEIPASELVQGCGVTTNGPVPWLDEQAIKLSTAESEYIEAALERDRIEAEIKSLKELLKEQKKLVAQTYDRLLRVRSQQPAHSGESSEAGGGDDPSIPPAAEAVSDEPPSASLDDSIDGEQFTIPAGPDGWRQVPIHLIGLDGIEGLGDKKREKLIDEVPTVGKLEDLRIEAAKTYPVNFARLLPKGIGKRSADEIENRLIDWLSKHRDGAEFSERRADSNGEAEADETESSEINEQLADLGEAAPAADDAGMTGNGDSPSPAVSDFLTPAEVSEIEAEPPDESPDESPSEGPAADPPELSATDEETQILTRARELASLDPRPTPGPGSVVKFGAIYEDGQRAANNDWPITDCNWTPGEQQDSWLLGWLSVRSVGHGSDNAEAD